MDHTADQCPGGRILRVQSEGGSAGGSQVRYPYRTALGVTCEGESVFRYAHGAHTRGVERADRNTGRFQVEEQVVRARGAEGAVVGQTEVVVLDRPEYEGGTGREDGIVQLGVLVHTEGSQEVEVVQQTVFRLQVAAELAVGVAVFVLAVHGAVGLRHRADVVQSVDEVELAPVGRVLQLRHEEFRLVHDGVSGRDDIGVAGVRGVQEGLEEPVSEQHAGLVVGVGPIHRLTCAETGEVDVVRLVETGVQDHGQVVADHIIQTSVNTQFFDVVVTDTDAAADFIQWTSATRQVGGPGLGFLQAVRVVRIDFEFFGADILGGDLHAHFVAEVVRGTHLRFHEALVATEEAHRRAGRSQRRFGEQVHHTRVCVRAVQGGARTENHLDRLDVVVGLRDEVQRVGPQRWNARDAVIGEHQQRSGEDVVEAARHDGLRRHTLLCDIDRCETLHVIGGRGRGNVADVARRDHLDRGGSFRHFFLGFRRRYDHGVQTHTRREFDVQRGGLSGNDADSGDGFVIVADITDAGRVRACGKIREGEGTVDTGVGTAGDRTIGAGEQDVRPGQHVFGGFVGHRAAQRSLGERLGDTDT